MTGLCISAESDADVDKAADFLARSSPTTSADALAATGYVMPTNLDAVNGDEFLQRGQRPLHADVFEREMRHTEPLPRSPYWPTVGQAAVAPLTQLFYDPVIDPLQERLEAIDEASVLLFDPRRPPRRPRPTRPGQPGRGVGVSSPSCLGVPDRLGEQRRGDLDLPLAGTEAGEVGGDEVLEVVAAVAPAASRARGAGSRG